MPSGTLCNFLAYKGTPREKDVVVSGLQDGSGSLPCTFQLGFRV